MELTLEPYLAGFDAADLIVMAHALFMGLRCRWLHVLRLGVS